MLAEGCFCEMKSFDFIRIEILDAGRTVTWRSKDLFMTERTVGLWFLYCIGLLRDTIRGQLCRKGKDVVDLAVSEDFGSFRGLSGTLQNYTDLYKADWR